jgi:hypothetical protein
VLGLRSGADREDVALRAGRSSLQNKPAGWRFGFHGRLYSGSRRRPVGWYGGAGVKYPFR